MPDLVQDVVQQATQGKAGYPLQAAPGKDPQIADDPLDAPHLDHDGFDLVALLGRRRDLVLQQFGVAANDRQRVVDLVGHPRSQKAEARQPFGPGQLFLGRQQQLVLFLQLCRAFDDLLFQGVLEGTDLAVHGVEFIGQQADLIMGAHRNRLDMLTGGDPAGALGQRPHRAGQTPADPGRERDPDQGHEQQHRGEDQVEVAADLQERPFRHADVECADDPVLGIADRFVGRDEPVVEDEGPVAPGLAAVEDVVGDLRRHEGAGGAVVRPASRTLVAMRTSPRNTVAAPLTSRS